MQNKENLNNIEFSIIIPVYNTSDYLSKCVQSALNQEQVQNIIEIILVDDGSTDESKSICDEYANKYDNVLVLHQKNQGLSVARNNGIDIAKGRYIILLDSDDYLDIDACKSLYTITKDHNYDMVVMDMKLIYEDRTAMSSHNHSLLWKDVSGREYLLNELSHKTMQMAAVLNVYRRDFINHNNLRFKAHILHEDEQFTPRAFLKAASVISTDFCFYNYLMRENSITNSKNFYKNVKDLYETLGELEVIYEKEQNPLKTLLMESLLEKYLYMYAKASAYKSEYNEIRNRNFVRKKAVSFKNKIKVLLFLFNDSLYCHISKGKRGAL